MPETSSHIEEIIGKKPNWLIRLGIGGMLLMLLTLLFVAWLVKYPDIITASVYISTPNPPIDLVSPTNAKIEKVFRYDSDRIVKKGSPLILLENTVSYDDVQKLKKFIEMLENEAFSGESIPIYYDFSKLGALQNKYNELIVYLDEYNEYIVYTPFKKRIQFLEDIIKNTNNSLVSSEKRLLLELEDKKMVEKDERRAKQLFDKGVVAETGYEKQTQRLLSKEIQLEVIRKDLINQKTKIVNLQKQLMELQIDKEHFYNRIVINIKNAAKALYAQIEQWSDTFVISAPINGTISIFKEFNSGDYLSAGNYVLTILPLGDQEMFAYGNFSVIKAGKLNVNNKAIIKLHSFPYREYGSIDGYIEKISDFPIKDMYFVKIRLPERLETDYEKKIEFKQRLSGEAELITEDRSLLSRVFSNLKYFLEKQIENNT